ncbi:hypothetical protein [Alistipes sp.]|uniref:hypothetical protein n=1 Tax=Alistipes sp. TaxID=1872444 RepID=UPI003AEFC0A1
MAEGYSIKALRAWLAVSALFFLLTGSALIYFCFGGPADGLTWFALGCAFVSAGLNTRVFYVQLRRKRKAEQALPF